MQIAVSGHGRYLPLSGHGCCRSGDPCQHMRKLFRGWSIHAVIFGNAPDPQRRLRPSRSSCSCRTALTYEFGAMVFAISTLRQQIADLRLGASPQ